MTTLSTPETIGARLETLRADRGSVLPHHGAWRRPCPTCTPPTTQCMPPLTVTGHHLTPFEREFV